MTISAIITALQSLEVQLKGKGVSARFEYEEVRITGDSIRLMNGSQTLKIPLVEIAVIGKAGK